MRHFYFVSFQDHYLNGMYKFLSIIWLLVFMQFNPVIIFAQAVSNTSISKEIISNGLSLLGRPYVAGTLDQHDTEVLVCDATKFDCVTFVEYVFAKSLADIKINKKQSEKIESILTRLRYKNGVINGYGSRIHYFSQWIIAFEQGGFGKNITKEIGGIPYHHQINFMSTHHTKYRKLQDSLALAQIKMDEKMINSLPMYFIPKNQVRSIQSRIQNGDIIAITTSIKGLDIVHTGYAYWNKDQLHLLHASSDHGKVMVSDEPLDKYLAKHKSQTGIMVVRPLGSL